MKITPLEIRQKTFEKAFRGVDKDEVQAFLLSLSQEWERMLTEQRDLKMQLELANRDVQKMREVESSLYKTLKTAEDTSTNIIEQANKQAELQLRESQFKCDQMMSLAREQARQVVEEAYKQAEKAVADMQVEVRALEQDYQTMERYLDTMVRDLSNLANEALEKVEKSKAKPKASTSEILKRAANVKLPKLKLDELLGEAGKIPLSNPSPAVTPANQPETTAAPAAERPVTPANKPEMPVSLAGSAPVADKEEAAKPRIRLEPSPTPVPAPGLSFAHAPAPAASPVSQPMRSQAAPGATRTVTPPSQPLPPIPQMRSPWPNTTPQSDPAPDHNTTPGKTDPAPDVNTPKPEIEQPKTPTPEPKNPEVEQPKPEVPAKEQPRGPEVEQPARDFPNMPGKPEVQPPLTESARKPEPVGAGKSKSFFDMFD